MFNKIRVSLFLFIFITLSFQQTYSSPADDKVISDINFKFTFKLPADWDSKDIKETKDKDGISYSFERKDKKMTIMLLAFKLSSVKNIDDFIYNMEKDISLNIPPKSGDYSEKDFGRYDMKTANYKDDKFEESIFYFRTKLPDSPNNFVYMLRFITETKDYNSDTENQIKKISETFTPTAE
jgi:hypothetical protein